MSEKKNTSAPAGSGSRGLFTSSIRQDGEYRQLTEAVIASRKKPKPVMVTGLCEGAADVLAAALCEDLAYAHPLLIVCSEEKEALRMRSAFASFGISSVFYPQRDYNFHNITASREFEQTRLGALLALQNGGVDAVFTTPDAAIGFTMPPEVLSESVINIGRTDSITPDSLIVRLVSAGYTRSELAEGPGQFAKRGGIIDVCIPRPTVQDAPDESDDARGIYAVRLEFFGDEIDRICRYDSSTQRVTDNISEICIPPAREVPAGSEDIKKIIAEITSLLKRAEDGHIRQSLEAELSSAKAALEGGGGLNFSDKYISLIYPQNATLLDYLPDTSVCIIRGNSAVSDRLKSSLALADDEAKASAESGTVPAKYSFYSAGAERFHRFTDTHSTVLTDSLMQGVSGLTLGGLFGFRSKHSVACSENTELLREEIEGFANSRYRIFLMTSGSTQAANYAGLIHEWGIPARAADRPDGSDIPISLISTGTVTVLPGTPVAPYELPTPGIAVISLSSGNVTVSKKARKQNRKKDDSAERILSFADLREGDYVVHDTHGIGKYMGITTLDVGGVTSDYITIQYAGADKLFLPADKLDRVSKYIGAHSDDTELKLSKFGGGEWSRTKARAKAALRDIAKELIALYAERMRRPGFAFPKDDDFQRDFEAAFEYDETDAQLEATDEIKKDMEAPRPMDRLLCGDVGYGKTEVAFRAIYKAILGGKQAALLVPTTILALQHYTTAQSRMRAFPVNVEMLSRFRTPKEQKKIIAAVEKGDVDLIIGTHRMLSKDIKFRDLGLLVIDEEQRFGVAQKEKIKQRSGNIDVLSLSATPIPRTLNMAMTGIRDISLLDEAPVDRLPVQTYVLEHDDLIVIEAVKRELRRGGQVFYLYNSVETIDLPAGKLHEAIPDANIVIAHGKMEKEQLEDIWSSMIAGEIDILVCTTIIETGVDVPNANTLIVQNAHRMGLSQLHQLRGRVGRSPRRAYAYFTFPRGRALSEISQKRLEAIREYAEFGAGFRIAMRDLEIRGAGSVLGAEQHGHLDAVGYDMYVKLLNEAILEEKGEKTEEKPECTVSLSVDAYIPDTYVESASQRMALYKRIAHIRDNGDRCDIIDELVDRYGEPPASVDSLLDISLIRAYASECGITSVTQSGDKDSVDIRIMPADINIPVWMKLSSQVKDNMRISPSDPPVIILRPRRGTPVTAVLTELFEKYLKIVANTSKSGIDK